MMLSWLLFEVAMHRTLLCALAALASLSLLPRAAHAQYYQSRMAFTSPYIEWGLRPDVPRVPYDGAPFSEKYITANFASAPLMFGADPNRLWAMYYIDRIDRAQRFGYALPAGYEGPPPPPPNPPRHGLLWNFFHRDRD
jgi:hypothetical protein